MDIRARIIAYYLPQYHPIPENDEWWGKGFTEWTNVAKAKPLFKGHYQPRIPADLGFYDLRLPETRIAQAELARDHGIEGFCYWHYWFGERRLLERPFNEVLKSGEPKFSFCLGWANESWTGIWHGTTDKVLMEQKFLGRKGEEAHFSSLIEAFFDKRYMTIEGKPIFYVYKPLNLPEPNKFVDHWKTLAIKAGLKGIYFIGEDWTMGQWNPQKTGFDASVPHSPGLAFSKLRNKRAPGNKVYQGLHRRIFKKPRIFHYKDYVQQACHELSGEYLQFPSVVPNWDNTPRCGLEGYVLKDSTPELFRMYLKDVIAQVSDRELDRRVIFVKSWNEWAEGNYLEPDLRFGRAYLEVCKDEVLLECKNLGS